MKRLRNINWTNVIFCAYILMLMYVVLLRSPAATPARMRLWRTLSIACQRLAYGIGQVGIAAESAYWTTADRVRGGF